MLEKLFYYQKKLPDSKGVAYVKNGSMSLAQCMLHIATTVGEKIEEKKS